SARRRAVAETIPFMVVCSCLFANGGNRTDPEMMVRGHWLVPRKPVKPDHLEGNPMIRHSHYPLSIGTFASAVGVSVVIIRRWCRVGKIREAFRTPGGHRRFSPDQLRKLLGLSESRSRVGYARVSSHDQKSDLVSQASRLAGVCDGVIEDLGSGLNCKKPGLRRLLTATLNHDVSTLYLTHKDWLVRFGHELIVHAWWWAGTDGVILDDEQDVSFEQELTQDVLALMTVFSARLYGRRSHQNRKRVA
ncbi:MAG: IS607 family transposase, partial [Pseudomonadota bacterium]